MTTWFTSDQHLGHKNIIRHSSRPFADEVEMDDALIRLWNEMVADGDFVFHLGDLTLRNSKCAKAYLAQLKGRIKVLTYPWHHDGRWLPVAAVHGMGEIAEGFESASGHLVEFLPPVVVAPLPDLPLKSDGGRRVIVLCHYPFQRWDRQHYGAWHLHGHSHGKLARVPGRLDVGVDCNLFRPMSLESIQQILR